VSDPLRPETTELLGALHQGDGAAQPQVWARVNDELRAAASVILARDGMRRFLQPTELLQQAYLRLEGKLPFRNRCHMVETVARIMRQVCVDSARHRKRLKRGGDRARVSLEAAADAAGCFDDAAMHDQRDDGIDHEALDVALRHLASMDPRKAQIVNLIFFGGQTIDQTAELMDLSARTVNIEWRYARSFLLKRLLSPNTEAPS